MKITKPVFWPLVLFILVVSFSTANSGIDAGGVQTEKRVHITGITAIKADIVALD